MGYDYADDEYPDEGMASVPEEENGSLGVTKRYMRR
jgi:hypothetical protein